MSAHTFLPFCLGQVLPISMLCHRSPCMAQHGGQFSLILSNFQGPNRAGVPEIFEADMFQICSLQRQQEDGQIPQLLGSLQISLDLPGAQAVWFWLIARPNADVPSRVFRDQLLPAGLVQDPPQEQMNAPHAAVIQSCVGQSSVECPDSFFA